jgi:hypothetical protein
MLSSNLFADTEMPLGQEPPSAPWTRISEESSLPPETSGTGISLIGADSGGTEELGAFLEVRCEL